MILICKNPMKLYFGDFEVTIQRGTEVKFPSIKNYQSKIISTQSEKFPDKYIIELE